MNHEQAHDLLPWYAAGTIQEDERQAVELHLKECEECSLALSEFLAIAGADSALAQEVPEMPANMLEQALAQVDDYEAERAAADAPASEPERTSWWDAFWNPHPTFARGVMAAQLALLVAFAVGLVLRSPEPGYGTLGGPDGGSTLSIQFVETATEAEIRALLEEFDGAIVDGPSALGLYTVRFPVEADEIDGLAEEIRGRSGVVRLATRGP